MMQETLLKVWIITLVTRERQELRNMLVWMVTVMHVEVVVVVVVVMVVAHFGRGH